MLDITKIFFKIWFAFHKKCLRNYIYIDSNSGAIRHRERNSFFLIGGEDCCQSSIFTYLPYWLHIYIYYIFVFGSLYDWSWICCTFGCQSIWQNLNFCASLIFTEFENIVNDLQTVFKRSLLHCSHLVLSIWSSFLKTLILN